jgi:hypothetical protein
MQVAAAVQKQVVRDFAPIWGLQATVDAFEDLASVPSDYYQVLVFGDPDELRSGLQSAVGDQHAARLIDDFRHDRVGGIHLNAFTRQPFALVAATDMWTVPVSHEILEMIVDPFANRLVAAAHPLDPHQRVNYLLEICDPCQAIWYPVNGVAVADFYTRRYFDPVGIERQRYSFTGEIQCPLHILEGGYLSWIDPRDSGLYQLQAGDSEAVLLADAMDLVGSKAPLRTVVDTHARTPQLTRGSLRAASSAASASGSYDAMLAASQGTALRTAEAIVSLAYESG